MTLLRNGSNSIAIYQCLAVDIEFACLYLTFLKTLEQ